MSHQLNDTHSHGYRIFLQSRDATILSNEGSTAYFFLNKVLSSQPNMNLMVGVVDCEIPVSYYNITANNNEITINGSFLTLVPQNYNAFNIQDELNKQLLLDGIDVIIEFSQQSNKFTFTPNHGGTIVVNGGSLCRYLGLTTPQINATASSLPLVSENCCDLGGTANIYVSSNFNINNLNSSGQYSGTLCKVLTNAAGGSYIYYQPSEIAYHTVSNSNINNVAIYLTDDNLNPLDFNGLFFSLTLSIEFSYKRETLDYSSYLLDNPRKLFPDPEVEDSQK